MEGTRSFKCLGETRDALYPTAKLCSAQTSRAFKVPTPPRAEDKRIACPWELRGARWPFDSPRSCFPPPRLSRNMFSALQSKRRDRATLPIVMDESTGRDRSASLDALLSRPVLCTLAGLKHDAHTAHPQLPAFFPSGGMATCLQAGIGFP